MEWTQAVAEYELANTDLEALGDDYEDKELNFYCEAASFALEQVMMAKAPDKAAIMKKLDLMASNEVSFSDDLWPKAFAALRADILKL